MSLGEGIFLSTLLVVSFILFRWIWARWGLKKIAIGVASSICGITLAIWGYIYYENFPRAQENYYGISIGMSKPEVLYVMGEATNVGEPFEDPVLAGWISLTKTNEISTGKSTADYDHWDYYRNDNIVRIDVTFDSASKKVKAIHCFSGKGYCQSVLGISTGTSEESVVNRLGKPAMEEIEGGRKTMLYSDLNLKLHLEKKAVYSLTVLTTQTGQVVTAPPATLTTAPVSVPPQASTKKKYRITEPSGQIYEIKAAEDAAAQELLAKVSAVTKVKDAWMKVVVTTDGAVVYADLSSVEKLGTIVRMSWLMDYQASRSQPSNHSSEKMQIEHDCRDRQMQILSAHQYHNYMGRGEASRAVPLDTVWLPVPTDGGQFEKMWKFACR